MLRPWLELDKRNIAQRSVGRIVSHVFTHWSPNVPLGGDAPITNHKVFGPRYHLPEAQIAPLLATLVGSYYCNRAGGKLEAALPLLRELAPYLDEMGKRFADGDFSALLALMKPGESGAAEQA